MTDRPSLSEAMDLTDCRFHEEGQVGPWRVERRVVDSRELCFSPRGVPPGTYIGLLKNGHVWMSDTPDEKRDHAEAFLRARDAGGRCLVHGLGLGMVVKAMLLLPNVEHVDVVEIEQDVIDLCGPPFEERFGDRVTIHRGDCFDFDWPRGTRWSVVWHDVWRDLRTDNLDEMATLHRKFGRRCEWQGSWGRELLRYHRRREAAMCW